MTIDYLAQFPIPTAQLPQRLRALLEPVGNSPGQAVEVAARYDFDNSGPKREYIHMLMAVVPDDATNINYHYENPVRGSSHILSLSTTRKVGPGIFLLPFPDSIMSLLLGAMAHSTHTISPRRFG